jgi:hypothetical protein
LVIPGEGEGIEPRDLDGDGIVDLLVRDRGGATVGWRNASRPPP